MRLKKRNQALLIIQSKALRLVTELKLDEQTSDTTTY